MNALEVTKKTEEAIIKTINDSALPLTTIYYMLSDLQRQIVEALKNVNEPAVEPKESE